MDARTECCGFNVWVGKGREHHNRNRRHELFEGATCIDTIHDGHCEVYHNEVWMKCLGFVDSVGAIFRLTTHDPIRQLFEQSAQTASYNRAIVND